MKDNKYWVFHTSTHKYFDMLMDIEEINKINLYMEGEKLQKYIQSNM